jgi:Mg-chelatase subunit ChlI
LIFPEVSYTTRDLLTIATLTARMEVDGHRADLVILKSARAHAAFEGRRQINEMDIARAAELALPHRMRRGPFQQVDVNIDDLHARVADVQTQIENEQERQTVPDEDAPPIKKKVSNGG